MEYQRDAAPPAHWGYGWGGAPALCPQPPRASKRAHSESDDCDDVFSEESSKDATSPSGGDSCQLMTRKRRRGVIEKKRRDRINTSLTELKRLVPTAYEKQGSAKLEKAEILQLTVDHLKMLHAKGLDGGACEPRHAMDYHSLGFRECASEVARYLVSCEGLDLQDPLRLRLMSHLQCFAAQRELAGKSWGYPPPAEPAHPAYEPPPPPPPAAPLSALAALPPSAMPGYPAPPGPHYPAPPAAATYPPYPHHPPPPPPHHPHHQYNHSSSKPYRPWGAELAY